MPKRPIDLRSDTVTQPTAAMKRAMMDAPLGDDVLGDDPTVQALEERCAVLLGKQAAVFVPSGSMANQLAIRSLTEPGDEIIGEQGSHFFQYEAGAFAALSGCSVSLIAGDRGMFDASDVLANIRPADQHFPVTKLVVVENTHNAGGGTVWPVTRVESVAAAARSADLRLHLDGARLMNASVASGAAPADYARFFDTVSMCFSKGLGAPVGSIVAGGEQVIHRARRFRKMLGGAMRQSGLLAAAALYALDHHVDRLADDHANARLLADGIAQLPRLTVDPDVVETNIVYFDIDEQWGTSEALCDRLESRNVLMLPAGPGRVRAVTHLDVTSEQVAEAIDVLATIV
ncbi:MAG: low-specificity L-threonine aldolase [Phycisphaerales bacterium]|nr:low-specificity L-threonine aldolase [Phycisphaerales bacterium]